METSGKRSVSGVYETWILVSASAGSTAGDLLCSPPVERFAREQVCHAAGAVRIYGAVSNV